MKIVLLIILGLIIGGTLNQFVRLARWPFRLAFWLTLGLLYCTLAGCADPPRSRNPEAKPVPGLVIINGGVNMGTVKEACYIDTENGAIVLRPCLERTNP